jgi:hypothetical protein
MLKFGIAYTPQGGALYNQRICFWKSYNEPHLFTNRFEAQKTCEFLRRLSPNCNPQIIFEKEAQELNTKLVTWMRDGTYSKLMELEKKRAAVKQKPKSTARK